MKSKKLLCCCCANTREILPRARAREHINNYISRQDARRWMGGLGGAAEVQFIYTDRLVAMKDVGNDDAVAALMESAARKCKVRARCE